MSDNKEKYLFAKKEFLKIAIALIILMIEIAAYYFYVRNDALVLAEKRAEIALTTSERIIHSYLEKIETIVNSKCPMVEYAIDDPDKMFDIAEHTMESDSHIMGAAIAFKENYYPQKGRWYETYVGHQNGSDSLLKMQLGSPDHDYLKSEWFKKGIKSKSGRWSDPYYDNAGGKAFVITYSTPIRDTTNEAVGVLITDITLDTLANIVHNIKLYPNSYYSLIAGDGTTLVKPTSSIKEKSHVFSKIIEGKNMTLNITIPDSDMYKRVHKLTLFFSLAALIAIFSVIFIAYHSIKNISKLNEVRIKEQYIEDELSTARNIQRSLMPSRASLKDIKAVDVKGFQIPAKYVGGDLYDYYVRDNKLFFCIGDVSGKGVPAALVMSISHSLFRTLSAHDDNPGRIMQAINDSMSDNNPDIMFVSMFLGIMNLSTGKISYCNAGHNPPILIKGEQAKYLDTKPSLILGVEPKATYTSYELELGPNDILFLYTDGLTEAENTEKSLFGDKQALETAAHSSAMTAEKLILKMKESVSIFVNNAEQSDDLTMLAIRRTQADTKSTLTLTNDIKDLEKLEPFLYDFFEHNNIDQSFLPKINLALEEALANVIMYAYPEGKTSEVTLDMETTNKTLHMKISDMGIPFNPLLQKEANIDASLEERQIGGLGIHLIKKIVDNLEYEYKDNKNILSLEIKTE